MKHIIKFATIAAAASLAGTAVSASAQSATERAEAKFVELTEGRQAGEPETCISAFRSNKIEVVENLGIAYEDGDTLWIARAANPRSLSRSDIPIFERFGSRLCTTDIIRTVDRYSHFPTGAVFLEDFVPYTKRG